MSVLPASFVGAIRAMHAALAEDAAGEGYTPAPVPTSAWLGAVLLDAAGLQPGDLMSGTTCILTGEAALVSPVAEGIRAAIPGVVGSGHKAGPGHLVVAEDCLPSPAWYAGALRAGAPVAAVTATGFEMEPQEAVILASREVEIPAPPRNWVLAAVVEAATGSKIFVREEDAAELGWGDLVFVAQPGGDHVVAADRIRRLAASRRPQVAPKTRKRGKVAASSPAAAPAGDGVVQRLADMPGFGADARAWGLALAADLAEYRAGRLAWRDVDRGILLSGPPGCGKTTFARALALECECELVSTTYGDWHITAGGGGDQTQKQMAKLFTEWRKKAEAGPLILFWDEIDSVGRRGGSANGDYWFGPIINSWLAFLDGAVPRDGIVVIGATNTPDAVDPAMLRPGRLDRHVTMPAPVADALAGVLRTHLGPGADLAGLDAAARACRGMSPADVGLVVREARRLARTTHRRAVAADDVRAVLDARRRHGGVSAETEWVVAVHEAGHALVMAHSRHVTLDYVDLDAAHARSTRPAVETMASIEGRLDILVAGMVAEQVVLGCHSAGCETDLRDATTLATHAHGRWGMGARGLRALTVDEMLADASVSVAVDGMLRAAHRRVTAMVEAHRPSVERLAETLVRQRYLDAAEVRDVIGSSAETVMEVAR